MKDTKNKKFCVVHRFWYAEQMCPWCYQDKNRGKFRKLSSKKETVGKEDSEEDYQSSLEKLMDKFNG